MSASTGIDMSRGGPSRMGRGPWRTTKQANGLLDLTGRAKSIASACLIARAEWSANGMPRMTAPIWPTLCEWLVDKTRAEPGRTAIAIETPHGPIVEMLLERGFAVYAVNPKQMDRFRDRFTVAGAKDDSPDAQALGDSLRTDRRAFRRLCPDDPVVVELREWSRLADDLKQERNRLANRGREQLWRSSPQMLKLTDDVAADWFLALWEVRPTPAKVAEARGAAIARLLKAHRIRRFNAAEAGLILRQKPLAVAPGAVEAATAHIGAVAERIRWVNQQLKTADRKLDELCARLEQPAESEPGQKSEPRDVAILRAFPGVGRINLATLLAEAWRPLERREYSVLRALSGVAPVTRRSGKACIVLRRLACNKRVESPLPLGARRGAARPAQPSQIRRAQATATAEPCAASAIACSFSPAPCCNVKPPSIQTINAATSPRPDHPLVRPERPSLRPDLPPAERRAQRKSPRRGRSEAKPRASARLTERARRHPCGRGRGHRRLPQGLQPREAT